MQSLVISDIHANLVALETILANAPAFDAVWCLGDVVGYGPAPNECVARLRGLNAVTLTGNHDQAVLGHLRLAEFRDTARAAVEWTRRVLTPDALEWLAALPQKQVLTEYDVTLVHGSPRDPTWEYIEDVETALANFDYFDTAFCFFGHTHLPVAYRYQSAQRIMRVEVPPERQAYQMEPRLLINPGSVGQPRDGDPRAAYAIYDTETHLLTARRIEYDIAATQRAMRNAGLPPRLVSRLEHGA